ncbi:hypothetical protein WMW72_34305 [Paenibacillus filicis]|uniref:Uncharacterized protein n=2 Tax=Paenibacillus filicis TaxID=669464 RepID=A0ABU9DVS6_9BACL
MVRIIGSVIISTVLSTLLSNFIHQYAIFFLVPVMIGIVRFVFGEKTKYSIWITIVGYVLFLLIQAFLGLLFLSYGLMGPEDMQPFTVKGYIAQVITFIIVVIISIFLKRTNDGFDFDFSDRVNTGRKSSSKPYVIVAIISVFIVLITYPNLYYQETIRMFYLVLVINTSAFFLLIFLSMKRDREEMLR